MSPERPFRFGAGAFDAPSAVVWGEKARRVEALGYDTLLIPDHFNQHLFAPIAALTAAALATTTLRVGTVVFDNDFRHPAVLAKETATLDVLSGGRLEVGIGAGWKKNEYDQTGIPFDPPGVRVSRVEEAVQIIKGLWGEGPFSFSGQHYAINGLDNWPTPLQRPRPPIFIGAGGKRMLAFAAREADIIGILAQALPEGGLDIPRDTEERLAEKVGLVREAAGERFRHLELSMLFWGVAVADDRRLGAEALAGTRMLTAEQILDSPYFLIGSVDAIVERLQALRELYGFSYFKVFPEAVEAFAPVVARLRGA
jgi:probable F420-dependent oxidoreductase